MRDGNSNNYMEKTMNCKTCKRERGVCSNLYWENWMAHYCSKRCWESSTEYKINYNLITTFLDTLGEEQFNMFIDIMDLVGDDYEFVLQDIIEERSK